MKHNWLFCYSAVFSRHKRFCTFLQSPLHQLTMMHRKSVCLSYSSGAIAQSWTPTTAFQSLSLKYVCLHLAPHFPDGQPKGKELSC